jgi:predicted phosphodiesterase
MSRTLDSTRDPVVYAIGDTHLGLRGWGPKGHKERPLLVADFFRWLSALPEEGYPLMTWDGHSLSTRVLRRPDRLILLGDILELWEAENQAILFSAATVSSVLAKVPCAKIYVLGNHDNILQALTGMYPLGVENLEVVGESYPITDTGEIRPLRIGDRNYIFIHGHQFDPVLHGRALPLPVLARGLVCDPWASAVLVPPAVYAPGLAVVASHRWTPIQPGPGAERLRQVVGQDP